MTIDQFLDVTLLIRIAAVIGLIGAFALAQFERGIRLRFSMMAFILYWSTSLTAQILSHLKLYAQATMFVAIVGTPMLVLLLFALVIDLRRHYRTGANSNRGGKDG